MGLEEALDEPGFWILAGGGVVMELVGWMVSKGMMDTVFPFWQLAVLMVGTVIAAAFFSLRG